MKRSRSHTDAGVPRDAKEWTAEDWRDLHEAITQAIQRIAARHRPEPNPLPPEETRPCPTKSPVAP